MKGGEEKLRVNVTALLMSKINFIAQTYDFEVGGYLIGEVKNGEVYLQDLLIPPKQGVSPGNVFITPAAQVDLRRRYGDKVFKIIGHWHSHHKMSAYFSGTDEANMAGIMERKNFFVFIVSNYQGHVVRVSMRNNPINYDINQCELYIKTQEFDRLRKTIEEIKSNPSRGYVSAGEATEENFDHHQRKAMEADDREELYEPSEDEDDEDEYEDDIDEDESDEYSSGRGD